MTEAFTVTHTFAAPRELVYEAWTRPEQFAAWFGTQSVAVPLETVSLDVRVGGHWHAVMHLPDGNTIDWHGVYTELDPPARLALTMDDDPTADTQDPITVTFDETDGGRTTMTLTQPRWDFTDEQVAATVAGYGGFFADLEQVLSVGARQDRATD